MTEGLAQPHVYKESSQYFTNGFYVYMPISGSVGNTS